MVFLIADVNKSKRVRRYAPWVVETAVRSSLAAERSQETSRGIQHLQCKGNRHQLLMLCNVLEYEWNSVSEGDVFEGAAGLVVRGAGLVGVQMRRCPELGFCER